MAEDVPSALLSEETKKDSPFDFDVDFDQVQKRRDRARAAKEASKEEEAQAILPNMDEEAPKAQPHRPNLITQRAKTTGDAPTGRGFFSAFLSTDNETGEVLQDSEIETGPFKVGNKCLAVWPFDDYHQVQKLYYEKLAEGPDAEQRRDLTANEQSSSIPIFSRPADPPDVPTAVQGVPLTKFEELAEERSIAIVSTWLFDAGLIDELLVNGGMSAIAISDSNDEKSVKTSEGVEIGSHGYPIEGSSKMDKEIAKLRNATQRQLTLINARLNDGVAATGSEVQELVNAVISTKDDIGRLRELSTYVSNPDDVEQTHQFMLTKYPKLKQAINARRNLARCFRELDFFSQIPTTCDRLREELHAGEWTAHEWSTIRSVCREHVELEMFLVEAEAGMKQRLDDADDHPGRSKRSTNKFGRQAFHQSGLGAKNNDELIDRFLEEHVENVWELGDEIRLRIMSGIATAFDLAISNPSGMVALVEAVEVYESANEEYRAVHGKEAGQSQTLRFTDMRPAALGELYKDFENRGLTVFRELTMQAADVAEEEEAANQKFSAVLRAANELTSEIGIVKEQMAPCFPPNWSIETLWTCCVAHVCSSNILQQIGGPDGQKLPDLTVTQLLDLVAWVETFREIIEETFPNIGETTAKKTYYEKPPQLLAEDSKTVDIEVAKDSLAWVQNTLWEVHDLSKDEFLFRTKEQTEEWLSNVYEAEHTKTQTAEGRLVTSLCEDVYALAGVQLRTIRDRLTRRSEALVQAVGVIFKNLYEMQIEARESFCTDFETCCAASNDFIRMSEKCEEIVEEIQEESELSKEAADTLEEQSAAILGLYSSDAVYAAQKTHVYCFEPIEEAIATELFGQEWEEHLTHNELALTLVRTLDDFMEDLETFLDEVMVQKAVEAQITSSITFYIKCLLQKTSEHNSNRASWFGNNERAIQRMRGDVTLVKEYFEGLAETMPTLQRAIEREFSVLEAVVEILAIAANITNSDLQDFALLLQKRVKNVGLTRLVICDLYHLVNPGEEKKVNDLFEVMEGELIAVAPTDDTAHKMAIARQTVPGLRLDEMMAHHCFESKRKRQIKADSVKKAEEKFEVWRNSTSE